MILLSTSAPRAIHAGLKNRNNPAGEDWSWCSQKQIGAIKISPNADMANLTALLDVEGLFASYLILYTYLKLQIATTDRRHSQKS